MNPQEFLMVLRETVTSLPKAIQKRLFALLFLRTGLGAFDLLVLGLVASAGALLTAGLSKLPEFLNPLLRLFRQSPDANLEERISLIATLGSLAIALYVIRSILAIALERQIYAVAARAEVAQGNSLLRSYVDDLQLLRLTPEEMSNLTHTLVIGVRKAYSVILGKGLVTISDIAIALAVGATVIALNPILAFATLSYLIILSIVLWQFSQRRIKKISLELRASQVALRTRLEDFQSTSSELYLAGLLETSRAQIDDARSVGAKNFAKQSFLRSSIRYFYEAGLVLGGFTIAGIAYLSSDLAEASNSFIVFTAAAARLAPITIGVVQFGNVAASALPEAKEILPKLHGRLGGANAKN